MQGKPRTITYVYSVLLKITEMEGTKEKCYNMWQNSVCRITFQYPPYTYR